MSARTTWPTWVTQTLKFEALAFVLPMCGALTWVIGGLLLLVATGTIRPQWALLTSLLVGYVIGLTITLFYLALTSVERREQLHNAGKTEALTRSLEVSRYLNWTWFVFGWLIILIGLIQSKRTAD